MIKIIENMSLFLYDIYICIKSLIDTEYKKIFFGEFTSHCAISKRDKNSVKCFFSRGVCYKIESLHIIAYKAATDKAIVAEARR